MRDRRQFLGLSLAALAASGLPAVAASQSRGAARLTLVPLTGRLSLVQGGAANIVVASSGSGLVLVDGGAVADARALRRLLDERFPRQPIRAVFNTHWHWDQTGFNAAARAAGADVVAHEHTRLWLTTEVNSRWEGRIYKPAAREALPNRTFFYGPQKLEFDGGVIEYAHLGQAHTDGDIYVRFPEENVIVAGDVLSPARYPVIDTACNGYLGGINTALRTMTELGDAQTRFVPGSGPVVGVDAVQRQQEMGAFVLARMSEHYRKSGTFEEFVATAPTRDFDAEYGDPARFLRLAYDSAWYHVNPMGGLPAGQPAAAPGRGR